MSQVLGRDKNYFGNTCLNVFLAKFGWNRMAINRGCYGSLLVARSQGRRYVAHVTCKWPRCFHAKFGWNRMAINCSCYGPSSVARVQGRWCTAQNYPRIVYLHYAKFGVICSSHSREEMNTYTDLAAIHNYIATSGSARLTRLGCYGV